jgi:hypothetical protein
MTTTPFEDAISEASTQVTGYIADGWPLIVLSALGLLGYKWFRRVAK